ncbi:MAG TPA: TolC family protein [Gemmataceae bacterium]|nr:TolC family protein [Gemmataceae bacterium]
MTRGNRKRWHKWVVAAVLAATGALGGCTKPLYMTPETQTIATSVGLPADVATNPNVTAIPDVSDHKAPPTILDSNREPRYMTLQEAMAIALERGTRGQGSAFLFQNFNLGSSGLQTGFNASFNDDLVQFAGRGLQGDDAIRAFALDPAIVAADIEGALAKFDSRFTGSMTWQKRDQAVANVFNNFNNGDFAAFSAGLVKPLPTGGTAGITFETNYTKLGAVPSGFAVINPSYTPALTFQFEQPLLRDYGVDINQLLPQHPGTTSIPGFRPTGGRAEGILVTRLRAEQAKADFEREVNFLVFNVELAYWGLYGRYYTKYATEQALRQAYVTWEQLQQLQIAGLQTKQGVAQARAQFEDFRLQYLVALQNVLEGERRLRGILGLPLEDGTRIVPADTPILAPYKPEWQTSLVECLNNRPELRMSRQELKIQQLNVMLQENNVRPDLRFFANYNINGIGTRLDGPGPVNTVDAFGNPTTLPGNALASFADNKFNNWNIGLRFDVPIGNRDAHATLKVAQLNLARSHVVLKNQERKAELFLGSLYQQLAAYHEQIKLQQARRVALGTQLQGQFERVKIGKDPLIQLLDAQRAFTGSIQAESDAIVSYNIAIAGFHLAKGTILPYNSISIADGPLPTAVAERAADHFAARAAGLKLRERAAPTTGLPEPAGFGLPGVADCAPPTDILTAPKPADGAPAGGGPVVIPPKVLPIPPGAKEHPQVATPDGMPGLSLKNMMPPSGPTLPAAASEGPGLPATPVSKFRPQ